MTIKPVGNQKGGEKKDTHGHVQVVVEQPNQNVVRSSHRNVIDSHGHQSPQRRNDVFDEIARHRRSPHKSAPRTKREHHLKREREREKISTAALNITAQRHAHPAVTSPLASVYDYLSGPVEQAALANANKNPSPIHQAGSNNIEDTCSGYNSGDEHFQPKQGALTADEWKARDEQFAKVMSERGFVIKECEEDGACLFRAISQQIYGDEEMHDVVRQQTMDYINQNREYFAQFMTEDINNYIKRKRKKDAHGNHIEIQAISEIYNRPVELYCYETAPINTFSSEKQDGCLPPLRLSYQHGSHYNAILDPYNATVGVGLGLPGLKPMLQTREAARLSEQLEIEQTMFEDKLKTTDWEATNEAMEEQIARESYLQWCRENMERQRAADGNCSASGSNSTATVTSAEAAQSNRAVVNNYPNCTSTSGSPLSKYRSTSCTITNANTSATSSSGSFSSGGNVSGESLGLDASSPLRGLTTKGSKDGECCDSDDTDMSSTSSVSATGGDKRNKKSKNRSSKSARRRKFESEEERKPEPEQIDDHTKRSKQTPSPQLAQQTTEIGPPTNKSPRRSSPPKQLPDPKTDEVHSEKTKTEESKPKFDNTPGTSKQPEADEEPAPVSQFYQSLLESSYADDGFGQLSEAEMLQQALRMSTIDFFEEQKRKFNF